MDCNSVIIENIAVVGNVLVPLIAALIGGAIAGGFTLLGVILTHNKDLERQNKNQSDNLKSFYQAIQTEVALTWQIYMSKTTGSEFGGIGCELEKLSKDQPFEISYPFPTESFPVYKANLHMIGQIPDTEFRTLIITTYAQGQGIVDSTVYNNSLVSKMEQSAWMYYKTRDQFYKDLLDAEKKGMVDYAKTMKAQHNEIKVGVVKLLEKLETILSDEQLWIS